MRQWPHDHGGGSMAGIRVGTGVGAVWGVILGPVGRQHTGQRVRGRACSWVFTCQSRPGAGGCTDMERGGAGMGLAMGMMMTTSSSFCMAQGVHVHRHTVWR